MDSGGDGAFIGPAAYARADGFHIAYQTLGTGPPLVLIADWFGHIDAMWDWPPYAHALRRLASFSQLIVFDKRGVGLSDPVPADQLPSITEWANDIAVVLDDLGVDSATLVGVGAGGPLCIAFATAHPDRTDRLVLVNSYARLMRAPDYRPGYPEHLRERVLSRLYAEAQEAVVLGGWEAAFVGWWRRFQRQSVSPRTAAAMREMIFDVDVRHLLPEITAPTIVLHRADDEWVRVDHGRYLADRIDGAELVELEGSEDLFFRGDTDALLDHIERFVTAGRFTGSGRRALATLLFTDITSSTARAAVLGDQRWGVVLDNHDAVVRRHVHRAEGRIVKFLGDGTLALFDTPSAAVHCAEAIRTELASLRLSIRVGIHVGEVEVRGDDVGGLAVHLGARLLGVAGEDEIVLSRAAHDVMLGSGIEAESVGTHELRGLPGRWEVYRVR